MKKILISLLAICALLLSTQAQAQTQSYYKQIHPNEISASYGVSLLGVGIGTVVNKVDDLKRWLGIDDDLVVESGGTKGVLNLGYTYQLSKVVSIGGAIGLNSMSVRLKDNTGKIDAARANIWMLMSSAKFDWFRTRSDVFGMYSKVNLGVMGIGASLMEDLHKTVWLPTGHLSLIGLEVGKGFSGFAEFGIGMQGIAQVGIRARF
jgi:opacity protein-like surface antigen